MATCTKDTGKTPCVSHSDVSELELSSRVATKAAQRNFLLDFGVWGLGSKNLQTPNPTDF